MKEETEQQYTTQQNPNKGHLVRKRSGIFNQPIIQSRYMCISASYKAWMDKMM